MARISRFPCRRCGAYVRHADLGPICLAVRRVARPQLMSGMPDLRLIGGRAGGRGQGVPVGIYGRELAGI